VHATGSPYLLGWYEILDVGQFPRRRLIGSWQAISFDFRSGDGSARSVSIRRMMAHTTSRESSYG
jgi:hypothetical protein